VLLRQDDYLKTGKFEWNIIVSQGRAELSEHLAVRKFELEVCLRIHLILRHERILTFGYEECYMYAG